MPTNYAPSATRQATITHPNDGEPRSSASVSLGFTQLADKSEHTVQSVDAVITAAGITPGASTAQLASAIDTLLSVRVHRYAVANHEARTPGGSPSAFYGLLATPTRLVAVGEDGGDGAIQTSTNGTSWTVQAGGTGDAYRGIAWSGAIYVLVGISGSGRIRTSSDTVSWTNQTPGGGALTTWNAVCWGGTQFVIVGGGYTETSPDGITWTVRSSGGGVANMRAVAWSGSLFVAVGDSGRIETSPDGITWTARTPDGGYTGDFQDVAFANGYFVAVGLGGAIQTSTNGTTWTARTAPGAANFYTVCWTGSVWVAAGGSGINLHVSADLATWVSVASLSYTNITRAARLFKNTVVMVSASSAAIRQTPFFG